MPRSEPGLLVMCFYMVEARGLEPRTYRLKAGYSKPLSYASINVY